MSSTRARQYHSVTFGEKNTWDDWHLIPASRPEFKEPESIQKFIDIPGRGDSSKVDISTAVVPYPIFKNRTGSIEFIVENDYGSWEERYAEIRNYLHGKEMRAILDDDPDFFYEGLFKLNSWNSNKDWSRIVIDYDVKPYKYDIVGSLDDWLWDPFDFLYGVINKGANLTVDGELTVTFYARQARIAPTIVSSSNMIVAVNGTIYNVPAGRSRHPLMVLQPGENTMIFRGNGTVSIDYRGGML